MTKIIDFTNCKLSSRNLEYAGRAGEKRGIVYNGEFWFLKFPKNTIGMNKINELSYVTSPLSEYIGSHIYEILGYDVHSTILGICNDGKRNKVVCACKDFIIDDKNELLIPYTALRNDTNDALMELRDGSLTTASNLNEIIFQLNNNTILKDIPNVKERFWDTVVIDLLINNNDRNEDNWGVIKFKKENKYIMSPIFDNGNSFYSKTGEIRIKDLLKDENKLISSSSTIVTAYEDDQEKRLNIKDILNIDNVDLQKSLAKVYSIVINKIDEIKSFINDIPEKNDGIDIMSSNRKLYYIRTMEIRLEMIKKAITCI